MTPFEYIGRGTTRRMLEKMKASLENKASKKEVEEISKQIAGCKIPYIVGNSTTAGAWTGTCADITEYRDGLTVLYKVNIAGVSGGTTLNINGLGDIAVKRNASTAVTTIYPVGTVLMLTYSDGSWLTADYDANTKNSAGTSNKASTKMYIVGATSQTSSGTTTYTNDKVYVGADNCLYSNGEKVATGNEIPTSLPASDVSDWAKASTKPTYTAEEVGAPTTAQFNALSKEIADQQTALNSKLPKNFGADNVGKILVVGSDGNLTLTDMPEAGASGDVVGVLDESKNILLTGDIAEGTYPLKWVLTDGTLIDAGTLTVTLTPEPQPTYINQIPISINADGTPFVGTNGEKGYKTGYRLSLSTGEEKEQEGTEVTGFIPVTYESVLRIKDIAYSDDTTRGVVGYDADFKIITIDGNPSSTNLQALFVTYGGDDGNGVRISSRLRGLPRFNTPSLKYIRLCSTDINENSILTVDQEIV